MSVTSDDGRVALLGGGGSEERQSTTGRASCFDFCFLCLFSVDWVISLGESSTGYSVREVTEAAWL